MRTFPIFALLFFAIPLIEIYFLIQVGEVIGALPTIFLVVLTAVIGAFLLRQQGLSTLARFQQSMANGELPATALLEGVMLLVGGVLLMTPGFFTDAIGFACLLPFTRIAIAKFMLTRMKPGQMRGNGTHFSYRDSSGRVYESDGASEYSNSTTRSASTLEGDYHRKDD